MATIIYVDQENSDLAPAALSKDRLKSSNAKAVLKVQQGKVFGSGGFEQKTSRKALGNINKQVVNQKAVPSQKGEFKAKKPVPVAKKVSETHFKQNYPEIEKFVPYNPKDFESFDVPEEHKLSHICLAGVSLLVNENEATRIDALLNQELSPMDVPSFSWEYDAADGLPSLLASLEEITLDIPPMFHC
ncbi:securin [Pseudophryne corroboree]|uniref:securin n=1 Tax=Pseudophryne corroboree TaxID=495146 RepID=UPI0030813EA6